MDSFMGLIFRIGALALFILCLDGIIPDAYVTRVMICGWYALIYANLEDIKEILKDDRNAKYDRNRDRGSD